MSQIKVRAFPAPGHEWRRRAGRTFGKQPVTLTVTANPTAPDHITPLQYAQLEADPRLLVKPASADDALSAEAMAQIAIKEAELLEAKRALAEAAELAEENRRAGEAAALKASADMLAKDAEIEDLRNKLAKKK